MGISESKCVNLASGAGQEAYLAESYTVVRTSGEQQTGWLLTNKVHRCYNQDVHAWHPRAHAFLKEEDWALSLHNGDHDDEHGKMNEKHACGWRTLSTFWPTRLTGDEAAIKAWTDKLRETIEELAGQQGVPDIWAQHSCGHGAPADMCDACCGERRAKEKKALLDELAAAKSAACEGNGSANSELSTGPPEHRVETIKAALARMPSAANHRLWLAYRAASDALEEARRLPSGSETIEMVAALQAEMEAAEATWRATLPPEPAPTVEEVAEDAPDRAERSAEEVEAELTRARSNYQSALMSDPGRHGYDRACDNFQTEVDDLERELAALGAKPYHPVYAPLRAAPAAAPVLPVKPLPEPMSAADRKLLGNFPAPEKPTDHGCAYDDGCPWAICYACEYERNPGAYYRKIRHSELIQLISAYWRSPSVGQRAKGWSNETLEDIVGFLDTPKEARPFTDADVANPRFSDWRYSNLVAALRELNA